MIRNWVSLCLIFIIWFLPTLTLSNNKAIIQTLNRDFFTLNIPVYYILWFLVTFLITYKLFLILKYHKINNDFLLTLAYNYLFYHAFLLFNFYFNNLVVALIMIIMAFAFSIFLYFESQKIDKDIAYGLLPYLLWLFLLSFLMITNFTIR